MQEVVHLGLGVVLDRLVGVEEARLGEELDRPTPRLVAGNRDGTLVERLPRVVELGDVDVGDRAHSLAPGAHAPQEDEIAGHFPLPRVGRHHPARLPGGDVEREGGGRADVGIPDAAEQDPQHGVGVGGGADRRTGVGAHPLLVDDDCRGQALEHVDFGTGHGGHEPLQEGAVRLVDQPLRLGGNGVEDQRALPRSRHPREHGQATLGDRDRDVLEVVLAGALDPDQVVTVGRVMVPAHPALPADTGRSTANTPGCSWPDTWRSGAGRRRSAPMPGPGPHRRAPPG
jgi:hypothetical protein